MRNVWAVARLLILEIFRKKDFYAAFVFTAVVLFYAARLRFYDFANTYRYLLDVGLGLSMFFAAILTVSLAARQFPSEVQNRTLHVLLAKPISRAHFVIGKFLGSFLSGTLALLLFFGVLVLFTLTKTNTISWAVAGQTYYLFCLSLMILTAFTIFVSFFMTAAANTTLTMTLFALIGIYGPTLHQSVQALASPPKEFLAVIYSLIPHFALFDMRQRFIHAWPAASLEITVLLTAYALVHTALFLIMGWAVFRRKNIS